MRNPFVAATHRTTLTLFDGMLLVAGAALGLALAREYWPVSQRPGRLAPYLDSVWINEAALVLYGLNMGVLLIQLRRVRPPLWRYGRQPGLSACAAVVVASAFQLATAWGGGRSARYGSVILALSVTRPSGIAPAIVTAWLALAIACRWRPTPTWPDRLGRGVAGLWLFLYALTLVGPYR